MCLIIDIEQVTAEDLFVFDQGRLVTLRTEGEIEVYRESIN